MVVKRPGSRMAALLSTENGTRPKVGLVQMMCTSDKEANFCQAKSLIERAKRNGAQV